MNNNNNTFLFPFLVAAPNASNLNCKYKNSAPHTPSATAAAANVNVNAAAPQRPVVLPAAPSITSPQQPTQQQPSPHLDNLLVRLLNGEADNTKENNNNNNKSSSGFRFNALHHTTQSVINVIKGMWAVSTWSTYARLWREMHEFIARNNLQAASMDDNITTFVESKRRTCIPSTRLTYTKALVAIAHRLGERTYLTGMYQTGLRALGAEVATNQAPPLRSEHLQAVQLRLREQRNGDRALAAFYIAWKSASRWDEISRLTGASFVHISTDEIIVHWGSETKASRLNPNRSDSLVVIKNTDGNPRWIVDLLQKLEPDELLTTWPTDRMAAFLRTIDSRLSAHSIKAGALAVLLQALEHNLVTWEIVQRIAKHRIAADVSSTTIGYVKRNLVTLARALQTSKATSLLHW